MFVENPFFRIKSPAGSHENVKSAIASCICPECGGALSLSFNQFRCLGRCGVDWRPVWNRLCQSTGLPNPTSRDFARRVGRPARQNLG